MSRTRSSTTKAFKTDVREDLEDLQRRRHRAFPEGPSMDCAPEGTMAGSMTDRSVELDHEVDVFILEEFQPLPVQVVLADDFRHRGEIDWRGDARHRAFAI